MISLLNWMLQWTGVWYLFRTLNKYFYFGELEGEDIGAEEAGLSPRALFRKNYRDTQLSVSSSRTPSPRTPLRSPRKDSLRKHLNAPPSPRASLVASSDFHSGGRARDSLLQIPTSTSTPAATSAAVQSVPSIEIGKAVKDVSPEASPSSPSRESTVMLFNQWFAENAPEAIKEETEFFQLTFLPTEDRVGQNIIFIDADNGPIRAVSLTKLIEVLVRPSSRNSLDSDFLELRDITFSTFTSFTTEDELLNRLGSMFLQCVSSSPPDNAESMSANIGDLLAYWVHFYWHQMSLNTRCRIVKFLRVTENILSNSEKSSDPLTRTRVVVRNKICTSGSIGRTKDEEDSVLFPVAQNWEERVEEIEKQREEEEEEDDVKACNDDEVDNSCDSFSVDVIESEEEEEEDNLEPQFPEGWTNDERPFVLIEWPAVEIARQLSLIEEKLFRKIETRELLSGRYNANKMDVEAPNLARNIHHFNALSRYLTKTILDHPKLEDRVALLEHSIEIVEHLASFNNFNTIMSIFGAMHSNSIYRLRETWASISDDYRESYEMLEELFSARKKMRSLRDAIDSSACPPVVPYLGLFLSDISAIDSTNSDFLTGSTEAQDESAEGQRTLINMNKRRLLAKVMRAIQTFQLTCRYSSKMQPIAYLQQQLSEGITHDLPTDNQLYERSCHIESRKEKKK